PRSWGDFTRAWAHSARASRSSRHLRSTHDDYSIRFARARQAISGIGETLRPAGLPDLPSGHKRSTLERGVRPLASPKSNACSVGASLGCGTILTSGTDTLREALRGSTHERCLSFSGPARSSPLSFTA